MTMPTKIEVAAAMARLLTPSAHRHEQVSADLAKESVEGLVRDGIITTLEEAANGVCRVGDDLRIVLHRKYGGASALRYAAPLEQG